MCGEPCTKMSAFVPEAAGRHDAAIRHAHTCDLRTVPESAGRHEVTVSMRVTFDRCLSPPVVTPFRVAR